MSSFDSDEIATSDGPLEITFFGHGSLGFRFNGMIIYVDPYSKVADYSGLPKASLILLTHEHRDHLDHQAIQAISTGATLTVAPEVCAVQTKVDHVLRNGDEIILNGIHIRALPAYNLLHKRENGEPYHPKGAGNGYVLRFGDKSIYVAGDTENIPEMKDLKDIEAAFLPMNLPYTMTPDMVAESARAFRPRLLYPYHFGQTDPTLLGRILENESDIEVRIRSLA